ncbi:carotenoid cleavage dioxygenase 1 [Xylariaceae sp. FL0255]|nr:carotenoid cleavage dioxygenase 1 [Xylariaceae sp. FL0255]
MATEPDPGSDHVDHRDDDFERIIQTVLTEKLQNWPNEAGFEGLKEVRGPVHLEVKGTIPSWAAGSLYRTGPGAYKVENTPKGTFNTTHWFDGFAHTHKFKIIPNPDDKQATALRVEYLSRRQAEDHVESIRKTGQVPYLSFGQRRDPCVGIFSKFASLFQPANPNPTPSSENVCVAVYEDLPGLAAAYKHMPASVSHRGGNQKVMYVTTDSTRMSRCDAETLEPLGIAKQSALHPLLNGPLTSAHAQLDPITGDLYNYNLDLGRQATYRIFRIAAATGKVDIIATIRQSKTKPAYIHSFFLSPSFIIFCVPSTHISYNGLSIPWKGNIVDSLEPFDPSKLCQWFVIDRHHGRGVVATFESPAGFFFHSVNAFEEKIDSTGEVEVACDVMEYPSNDIIRFFEMNTLLRMNGTQETFWGDEKRIRHRLTSLVRHRFRVPQYENASNSKPARVAWEKVFEIKEPHAGELPTINRAYATKKYRYIYSLPTYGLSTLNETIVKTDIVAKRTTFWQCPKGHTPSEAIFVARPRTGEETKTGSDADEEDEDDGVLLSVVLDGFNQKSYLVCIDAKTMKETGRVECDWAVGHGFHGLHTQE